MKRIISILALTAAVFSLTACFEVGSGQGDGNTAKESLQSPIIK